MNIFKQLIFLLTISALVFNCSESDSGNMSGSNSSGAPGVSKAGSMAAFAVNGQYLYVLDNNQLLIFSIANPSQVAYTTVVNMPQGITAETLYPYGDYLFIGTMQGVLIYNSTNAAEPVFLSMYEHVVSCDPVVVNGQYAYVTLRTGTRCPGTNQLEVLDLIDITNPKVVGRLSLFNPHGLDVDDSVLVVCEGSKGFKTISVANPKAPKLIAAIDSMQTYDVITWNKVAIITGKDGIYQYNYSNPKQPVLLSKISIQK